MLICLDYVFAGIMDVSVGGEDLIANYVQFFSVLMNYCARFSHNVVDVHYTFGYGFDLVVFLVHETSLHFELDLQILFLVKRILMSLITATMSNFIPCATCMLLFLLILHTLRCWKFFFLSFYLLRYECFMIIRRIQKLLPSISLNSKLLLSCSNLPCCIWIKV